MESLWHRQAVLVTGKGGVGRTLFVAAAAATAAQRGRRVLVADLEDPSSDRRSALARLYRENRFSRDPQPLQENVWGVHIETEYGTELFLRSIFRRSRSLVGLAMRSRSLQRLLYAAPSFREMGMFFHLLHLAEETLPDGRPRFDHIFIDLPATGHTLAMTSLPQTLLALLPTGPIAEAFRRGQNLFNNPNKAATWVVTLPETLPVSETIELVAGLRTTGMPLGGLVLNRWPDNPFEPLHRAALEEWLQDRCVRGRKALERIDQAITARARLEARVDLPLLVLPDLPLEGPPLVTGLAEHLAREAP